MHLERDILKGKFGKNKELKNEAREELREGGWSGWGNKKDRFKRTGTTAKTKALSKMKGRTGSGTSRFSGKSYKHD